jgi:hypothetical protein
MIAMKKSHLISLITLPIIIGTILSGCVPTNPNNGEQGEETTNPSETIFTTTPTITSDNLTFTESSGNPEIDYEWDNVLSIRVEEGGYMPDQTRTIALNVCHYLETGEWSVNDLETSSDKYANFVYQFSNRRVADLTIASGVQTFCSDYYEDVQKIHFHFWSTNPSPQKFVQFTQLQYSTPELFELLKETEIAEIANSWCSAPKTPDSYMTTFDSLLEEYLEGRDEISMRSALLDISRYALISLCPSPDNFTWGNVDSTVW